MATCLLGALPVGLRRPLRAACLLGALPVGLRRLLRVSGGAGLRWLRPLRAAWLPGALPAGVRGRRPLVAACVLGVLPVGLACGLSRAPSPHLDAPGACAASSGPRLCLASDPDRPLRLTVELDAGRTAQLLPGECLVWPSDVGGGSARVRVYDGDTPLARRRLRLPAGRTTTWTFTAHGSGKLHRHRCAP